MFRAHPSFPWLALRSSARRVLWISLGRKLQTVARLLSQIPAPAYRFWARVKPKARSLEARAPVEAETPVIMPPIRLAPRAANLLSLNRLRVPRDLLDRVCPVRDGALLLRNSRQRKTEYWRAGRAAADSNSVRVFPPEIHLSGATVSR